MIFAKYLILFWVSLSFLALLGKTVFNTFKISIPSRFTRSSFEVFTGILAVVFFYSITITRFQTLYLGLVIPIGYGIILWRQSKREKVASYSSPDFKTVGKDLLYILLVGTPLVLLWFHGLYNPGSAHLKIPVADHFFYSDMSDNFNQYHRENNFGILNKINPGLFSGSTPYHYTEIWLNAFFSTIFRIPGILSLLFIVFPILNALIVFGFLALWETQGKIGGVKVLLSYALLYIAGGSLDIFNKGIHEARFWYNNIPPVGLYGVKLSVIYVVLAVSLATFLKGKDMLGLFIFSLLAFLYVTVMPGVLAASALTVFVLFLIKRIQRKEFFFFSLYLLFVALYISVFYTVNRNELLAASLLKIKTPLNLIMANPLDTNAYQLVLLLNGRYLRNLVLLYILYLPFVLVFMYLLKARTARFNYVPLFSFLSFVLISLMIAPLWEPHYNAFQFFSNSLPAIALIIAALFVFSYEHISNPHRTRSQNRLIRTLLVLSFLFIVWQYCDPYILRMGATAKYSDAYLDKCLDVLKSQKEKNIVGVLYNKEDLASNNWWVLVQGPDPIYLVRDYPEPLQYVPLNINDYHNYRDPEPLEESSLKQQPLYIVDHYDSAYKAKKPPQDLALYFLSKYPTAGIFANKGAFPSDSLYPLIKDSIMDAISGEKLYTLRCP